jgi:Zn-dependent protease
LTSAVLINSILCCFNLIPIPPLDGSRVLAYLLPERQARLLDRLEPIGFFVVVTLIMLGGLDFMSPLITAVADLFLRLLSLTT